MLSPELDISKYVETVTDSDGTVTHIFKPVTKKLEIVCVEEKGKPIKPLAKWENPAGLISEYEIVDTKIDPKTRNVVQIFKPKTLVTPTKLGKPTRKFNATMNANKSWRTK